jgi:hypothetical protein
MARTTLTIIKEGARHAEQTDSVHAQKQERKIGNKIKKGRIKGKQRKKERKKERMEK